MEIEEVHDMAELVVKEVVEGMAEDTGNETREIPVLSVMNRGTFQMRGRMKRP